MNDRQSPGRNPRRSVARGIVSAVLRSISVLLIFLGVSLIALFSFEQATLRPLAEIVVERLTGRSLQIEGDLDAVPGSVVRLRIGRASLANADWGSEQAMLRIADTEVSFDLLDLLRGGYLIDDIVVGEGRLLFERNAQGRSNWALGSDGRQTGQNGSSGSPISLPARRSRLSDIAITVIDPALTHPLDVRIDRADHEADAEQGLQASLDAEIDGQAVAIKASLVLPDARIPDTTVDFFVEAVSGATRFAVDGNLDDLLQPRQANLLLILASADISNVTAILGLPTVLSGATDIEARLAPADGQHAFEIAASVGELELDARGGLQSLDMASDVWVDLTAAAPNLAAVVRLPGRARVPARPFNMHSKLALSGNRLEIGESHFDLGEVRLTAEGVMSRFPNPEGTRLDLRFEGDDYLEVAGMLGYTPADAMEPAPFEVRADLDYGSRAQQTFEIDVRLADLGGKLSGIVAGYPALVGSSVDYRLAGEDAGLVQQWLARPAQLEGAYTLEGRVTRTDSGFELGDSKLILGENRIDVSGSIGNQPLRRDTALALRFEGPDLGGIAALAGYGGFLPAGFAEVDLVAETRNDGLQLEKLVLRIDRSEAAASGFLSPQTGLSGSRIDLALKAADIAEVLPPELHAYLQGGQALELTGRLEVGSQQFRASDLQVKLGETSLRASGRVSRSQPLRDAEFEIDAEGPDLAAITPAELIPYALPIQPFTVAGGIGFDTESLVLDEVTAVIGSEEIRVSGSIPLEEPGKGLNLVLAARGDDIGIFIPADLDGYGVDSQAYEAAASVALDDGILSLRQLRFANERGSVTGDVSISIENPRGLGRFDLEAKGDNLQAFLPPMPSYQPASEPFVLDARGGWEVERITVEQGLLEIDGSRVEIRGETAFQAGQAPSRLVLSARGDSLADFGRINGLKLPQDEFQVDATFEGDATQLSIPVLDARVGKSDLRGRFAYRYGEKPGIEIALQSQLIDLAEVLGLDEELKGIVEEPKTASTDGRMIPDVPVPVEYLNSLNLVSEIDLVELRFPRNVFHNIEFDSSLQDGDLNVNQLRARGVEGEVSARFRATAEGERIVTHGELEGVDIVLGGGEASEEGTIFPKQNFHLEFDTAGSTSRELAANLDGFAQITGVEGRMSNSNALGLYGNFFDELLISVNPSVTREPYTTISCFAAYAEIVNGLATINPGAVMQTDKIDIYARGQIDLGSEEIALRFDTSAREGLGVSLGDFINPFVGVGGTLAEPRIGVDPKNAMFEGGFALATGGTTVVLKSLYRRWFGSGNPCADFAAEAEEYLARRQQGREKEAQSEE